MVWCSTEHENLIWSLLANKGSVQKKFAWLCYDRTYKQTKRANNFINTDRWWKALIIDFCQRYKTIFKWSLNCHCQWDAQLKKSFLVRNVKDRVPRLDEIDLEDEAELKDLMHDCQNNGVSPFCVKHLR